MIKTYGFTSKHLFSRHLKTEGYATNLLSNQDLGLTRLHLRYVLGSSHPSLISKCVGVYLPLSCACRGCPIPTTQFFFTQKKKKKKPYYALSLFHFFSIYIFFLYNSFIYINIKIP